jgi:hypothetical protein
MYVRCHIAEKRGNPNHHRKEIELYKVKLSYRYIEKRNHLRDTTGYKPVKANGPNLMEKSLQQHFVCIFEVQSIIL